MSVYDFVVKTNKGAEKSLADYRGKVLVIVNTASKCGFTPQFEELQALYTKQQFCRLNYGVSFPIFEKGDVRGDTAQPLFQYLTAEQGFQGFDLAHPLTEVLTNALKENFPEYLAGNGIKWNFTKFLIDREGKVVARFEPTIAPSAMAADIEKLL